MRIQQADNHDMIKRLFSSMKQDRIRDMNARIAGEKAISPRANIGAFPVPTSMFGLTGDDAFSALNPNHIRGLDATNGRDTRIIELPEHMIEAMITFAREDFTRGFGMGNARDGERFTMLRHSFLREIPEQDRQAALHTMTEAFFTEVNRIHSAVREAVPNWTAGQRVSDDILIPILNGAGSYNTLV